MEIVLGTRACGWHPDTQPGQRETQKIKIQELEMRVEPTDSSQPGGQLAQGPPTLGGWVKGWT